jgi:hypothetical protein
LHSSAAAEIVADVGNKECGLPLVVWAAGEVFPIDVPCTVDVEGGDGAALFVDGVKNGFATGVVVGPVEAWVLEAEGEAGAFVKGGVLEWAE